jgi:hypothetical protein
MQLNKSRKILQGSNSAFSTQNIYSFLLVFLHKKHYHVQVIWGGGEGKLALTRNPASHTPGRTPAVLVMMSTDLNYTSRLNEFLAIRTWIPASVVSHSFFSLFLCVLIIYFYFLPLSFLPFLSLSLSLFIRLLHVHVRTMRVAGRQNDGTVCLKWRGLWSRQRSQRTSIIIRICVGISF